MNADDGTPVVVIGGGIAGLVAACYLARQGVRVTLFERASRLGGQAASQREEGWILNRGAHALYPGGAASAAFRELGTSYRHNTPTATFILHQGQFRPVPSSLLTFARVRFAPRDTLELIRFFASLPRLCAVFGMDKRADVAGTIAATTTNSRLGGWHCATAD